MTPATTLVVDDEPMVRHLVRRILEPEVCGVVEVENGFRFYHAGDTNVFGDMRLIRDLYRPQVALLPIGGHYTMGPADAGRALDLIGASLVVPVHYGTFPILAGTPEQLRDATSAEVVELQPGETWEQEG